MKKTVIVLCSLFCTSLLIYAQTCSPDPVSKYDSPIDHVLVRTVAGKTYNVRQSPLWRSILGGVDSQQDGIVIVYCLATHNLMAAVTNYTGDVVITKPIKVVAMRIGTYNSGGMPLELFDCGTPYTPPPPTPEQIKAAQEAARLKIIRDHEKMREGQTNAVRFLQPQATNGDASAQCELGLHYLNGQGCETNREQAIYWLQKSATQGYLQASNKLSQLNSP